jgi:hypothetical protein
MWRNASGLLRAGWKDLFRTRNKREVQERIDTHRLLLLTALQRQAERGAVPDDFADTIIQHVCRWGGSLLPRRLLDGSGCMRVHLVTPAPAAPSLQAQALSFSDQKDAVNRLLGRQLLAQATSIHEALLQVLRLLGWGPGWWGCARQQARGRSALHCCTATLHSCAGRCCQGLSRPAAAACTICRVAIPLHLRPLSQQPQPPAAPPPAAAATAALHQQRAACAVPAPRARAQAPPRRSKPC